MINKIIRFFVNTYWKIRYGEWSDAKVKDLFDNLSNQQELSNWLVLEGFKWDIDGTNFSIWTDSYARPGQILARKFGNCTDFGRLYSEFIKYKQTAEYIEEIMFSNDLADKWHFVIAIKDRGKWYVQSNLTVSEVENKESIYKFYNEQGFSRYEIVDQTLFKK